MDKEIIKEEFKVCTKCNRTLHRDNYYNKSASKDGKFTYCKDCCKSYSRETRSKRALKQSIERQQREVEYESYVEDLNSKKTCKRCGIEKVVTDFHRETRQPDFRSPICIECKKKRSIENELKRLEKRGY